ncbi:TonB-dependent receptor [Flavihumibacter sp. R14]|nr:TonB-dependent receptor [Flavihumibacter soli]
MKAWTSAVVLLFLFSSNVFSQTKGKGTIQGTVKTSEGKPAEFVNIIIKNIKNTVVDVNGDYQLKNLLPGNYEITASYHGLESQSKSVVVTANQTAIVDFILNESSQQLKEVVVQVNVNKFSKKETPYVSKMPLANLENPQVYQVVNKELLTEQMIFSVDDAIMNTPGIQKMWEATGRGGDGGTYYNTRGFIVQSGLRNGIAGLVTNQVDAINLERMEVIKGPSATLFGSELSSYGGLINRVTKKPFDTFNAELSYSTGSYDFNRVSADVNTPVDKAKKLMFRLNTAYNYEGSFQDQGYNRSWAATPSLLYQANDRLSINLDAELYEGKNIGKQILFFYFPASALGASTPDQLNVDYNQSYMGEGLSQESRSANFFGQINYKLADNWTSSTNLTSSNSFSNGFSPYFYLIPDDVVTSNPADAGKANYLARADQSTGDSENSIFQIQQNFNGDFKLGNLRNRIVLGLDYYHTNSNQNFFGSGFDVVPLNNNGFDFSSFNGANMQAKYATGDPDFTYPIVNKINIYSAYVSNVLNLTENLNVLAALRVDRFENKGGTEGGVVLPFKQTAFSPKFGVVYQPVKDILSLFVNYQNGFNNKGTYNAYNAADPATPVPLSAKPEQANQVEGGVKLDALQGKLSGTVSYYSIKVEDILRSDSRAPNIAQIQDGTQVSKGIEMDFIANPVVGLNLIAGFSYNDSKMEKADADVNGRRPATASSPYLANLWLSYRLQTVVKGLGAGLGVNYASDNKILNSVSMGEFTLPAYTILGATLFYDKSKYRIGLKADNLTNERYYIGYSTMNPQKLRSFSASVSYKFN